MPMDFDLNLLPVARYAGQDYPELLGLNVAEPPRNAARGRAADRMVLYLAMQGNAPLAPGKQEQVLGDLARLYYRTAGAATTAMRAIVEELNRLLLERNLRLTSSSRQGLGLFALLIIHGEQAYLAQSGPLHSFLITAGEVREFYDPDQEGSALGQGRTAPVTLFQMTLQNNDTLLLAAQPSQAWNTETLIGAHGQGPESLRRRLFGQAETDINAVLIQAKAGKGKFYLPRPKSAMAEKAPTGEEPPPSQEIQAGSEVVVQESPQAVSTAPIPAPAIEKVQDTAVSPPQRLVRERKPTRAAPAKTKLDLSPLWKILVAIGTPFLLVLRAIGRAFRAVLVRLMPEETLSTVPTSVMAFVALAVPVVVVSVASVAYFQLGRQAQYEILYKQAKQMAVQAVSQQDVLAQRTSWESSIQLLQQAERFRVTTDTQALLTQARKALDELDLIQRVYYQPAIVDGLPAEVNVIRMLIAEEDLYLLDGNSGRVIRTELTQQGYKIDPEFQCGPATTGVSMTGPLIDVLPWPTGFKPKATLLALDKTGNVLYCSPGNPPSYDQLLSPPNVTWTDLAGFALDQGDLYVLDPLSNQVWFYRKSEFSQKAVLFFDQQIPTLQNVVDLAVNGNELYLLHSDGRITLCFYTGLEGAPTRCSDPAYIDYRPGRENTPLIPQAPFTQIFFSPPPDPSLFLMEPKGQAVYHFSLRNLAFQGEYRPGITPGSFSGMSTPNKPATAFYVDTARRYLFLATGNEVFYVALP